MTLQTNIDSFQDMDPGYLPPHLCMMELAYWIDKSAKARVHQYDHPWAHWIQSGNKWNNMSLLPESQIQGYNPVALRTDISGHGCAYCDDCDQCHNAQDALALHGQYACPDHNQRKYDPQLLCKACKRRGHLAAKCDMLAQALLLTKSI